MAEGVETAKSGGKKGGPIGIIILIIVIIVTVVLMLATYSAYIDYTEGGISVLQVKVKLADGEHDPVFYRWITETQSYAPYIKNLSSDVQIDQVLMDTADAPGDGTLSLADRPALIVYAFNTDNSWTSGKASVRYTGPDEYELLIGMPAEPEPGDTIRVVIEVVYDKSVYPNEDVFPLYITDKANLFYEWQ